MYTVDLHYQLPVQIKSGTFLRGKDEIQFLYFGFYCDQVIQMEIGDLQNNDCGCI